MRAPGVRALVRPGTAAPKYRKQPRRPRHAGHTHQKRPLQSRHHRAASKKRETSALIFLCLTICRSRISSGPISWHNPPTGQRLDQEPKARAGWRSSGHKETEIINADVFQAFQAHKAQNELSDLAGCHGLERDALQGFVAPILDRMIFDGEQLSELFAPLELGWKARSKAELALMEDLAPFLKKQAGGREISGLKAYE